MTYPLSRDELERQLAEQLGLLQRSADLFDQGYEAEAKRLAVGLRVLLHSKRYPSLLKQLDRDQIPFLDTSRAPDPANLLSTHSLLMMQIEGSTVRYVARLDEGSRAPRMTPFQDWWSDVIFLDRDKRAFSRADIVLSVADQDGGAHVDATLRPDYAALTRLNSLGWRTDPADKPVLGAERAAVRQIAHEVLRTLVPGYTKTAEQVRSARREPEISGGKLRFFPWAERFIRNVGAGEIVEGEEYLIEITVDNITCGEVYVVVGDKLSEPIKSPGLHRQQVRAGAGQVRGVFGAFTDAIVDRIGIWSSD